MFATVQYQGYTITAPPVPSDQGQFTSHPTAVQVVSQVDQNLLFVEPTTFETILGETPANELVPGTVTLQCYWDTVYNVAAQDTQASQTVTYAIGITSTDSETTTFGLTFGVEGGAIAGLAAALSATFSTSETHSVSLTKTNSIAETYTALPGTTLQVWQLHAEYIAEFEKDGKTYRNVLRTAGSAQDGLVLALTFPESAAASSADAAA